MKRLDLGGQPFGRLIAVECLGRIGNHPNAYWRCKCSCGNEAIVNTSNLRSKKSVQSCGCLRDEKIGSVQGIFIAKHGRSTGFIHGHAKSHSTGTTPTYNSWSTMIQRCTNPDAPNYPSYGGVGVKVCERWMTFENFLADVGERPEGTTLGRFGDLGNYEFSNCSWQTWAQQRAEAGKKKVMRAAA
jgi:hypothetical protein